MKPDRIIHFKDVDRFYLLGDEPTLESANAMSREEVKSLRDKLDDALGERAVLRYSPGDVASVLGYDSAEDAPPDDLEEACYLLHMDFDHSPVFARMSDFLETRLPGVLREGRE